MIQRMVEELKSRYACKTQDTGVFKKVFIEGARFQFCAYDMKGLGRVSTVEMKRLIGLWDMQSMFIVPYEKDMPIYYYIRHREKGQYIYRVELIDTMMDTVDTAALEEVVMKYKELTDIPQDESWYEKMKLTGSAQKEAKKKEELSDLAWEHFIQYLNMAAEAKECKPVEKKKKVKSFADALCKKGGIAVIRMFLANYGEKVTEKLAYEVLFGLK